MSDQPNIVLVTVDSLRSDHAYEDVVETPNFDAVTEDGVRFDTAVAQGPFTTFSMPSLFTSRYPSQLTRFELPRWGTGAMVGDAPTLPQRLGEAGYQTLGIHSNPLLSRTFGFEKGFDQFYDSLGSERVLGSQRLRVLADKVKRVLRAEPYVPADVLTDIAVEWIEAVEDEPFFLWVHYMDVHGPYKERDRPPVVRKFLSEWRWQRAVRSPEEVSQNTHDHLRTTYKSEVEYTDRQFGRLLDTLQSDGYYDDSLFVYTADHGEEFAEHGSYSHGNKLYEELLRVPLVVDPPGAQPGETVSKQVPLLDVAPTLVTAADGDDSGFEGEPLQTHYRDDGSAETDQGTDESDEGEADRVVISEANLDPDYTASVRTQTWKFLTGPNGDELYDLDADPSEAENVVDAESETADSLRTILSEHRRRTQGTTGEIDLSEDGDVTDRLERLGYI